MNRLKRAWTDERMEVIVGHLLRVGVLTAALVVLFGAGVYLVRHGSGSPDYGVFRGEPEELRSLSGIIRSVLSFRGRGLIQLGLVLLIATPVARVAFCVFAFARARDRLYVIVTLIVLSALLFSLTGS
ncbi:MAG TPA: DUF1634 domain-containing protein [Phycisphaerae bacterium]|nr:DUF1634 domain-containing protein [Phycisphaerae bacterium]